MAMIASRELRNHTRDVVMRAASGEEIVITVDGIPVAELRAVGARPRLVPSAEFLARLAPNLADPALLADVRSLSGDETTDDLPWP